MFEWTITLNNRHTKSNMISVNTDFIRALLITEYPGLRIIFSDLLLQLLVYLEF